MESSSIASPLVQTKQARSRLMDSRLKCTITLLFLAGCSSGMDAADIAKADAKAQLIREQARQAVIESKQEQAHERLDLVPKWVIEPPQNDSEGVYGVGIGTSSDLAVAIDKAKLKAKYLLVQSLKEQVSGNEQNYIKDTESKTASQYTQLIDTLVADVPLAGYRIVKQDVVPIEGKMNAFVLMKLSYADYEQALLKDNPAQSEEIKSAFNELHHRVALYKQQQE